MSVTSSIADHYNNVVQKTIKERRESDIIGVRHFNNAMKCYVIYLGMKFYSLNKDDKPIRILDLSCGKGGDLIKYNMRNVSFVGGADIADVSIEQCKDRFQKLRDKCFDSKFVVADLTRESLKQHFDYPFTFAFSQFAIHYSFESYDQALRYIQNAADNLENLGFFIGTYPDGPKILKLARESETRGSFAVDDILEVKFKPEDLDRPKPFGFKYHFKLKEAVDCSEFLVHPKILEQLLQKCGFHVITHTSFEEQIKNSLNKADKTEARKFLELFERKYKILKRNEDTDKLTFDESTWKVCCLYRWFMCRLVKK